MTADESAGQAMAIVVGDHFRETVGDTETAMKGQIPPVRPSVQHLGHGFATLLKSETTVSDFGVVGAGAVVASN